MSLDTLLEAAEFLELRSQVKTRGMFLKHMAATSLIIYFCLHRLVALYRSLHKLDMLVINEIVLCVDFFNN